jgi:hypothetical protein
MACRNLALTGYPLEELDRRFDPVSELSAFARQNSYDLVFTGRRGHRQLAWREMNFLADSEFSLQVFHLCVGFLETGLGQSLKIAGSCEVPGRLDCKEALDQRAA